jgi:hypothetical protein
MRQSRNFSAAIVQKTTLADSHLQRGAVRFTIEIYMLFLFPTQLEDIENAAQISTGNINFI